MPDAAGGSLFPEQDLLARLPASTRPHVERILDEVPATREDLLLQTTEYLDLLGREDQSLEFMDLGTARKLAEGCRDLVGREDPANAGRWSLVHTAVRYFVLDEDGEVDRESPIGFDDDVELFNIICGILGHEELVIPL